MCPYLAPIWPLFWPFQGVLPPEYSQNGLFLSIYCVLGFQILYFLVRSFEMFIVVYGKMFAPILHQFGLSSGHFKVLLPPENSQKSSFGRHLWRHNSRWRHFWSLKMLLLCCWQNVLWDRVWITYYLCL